MAVESGARFGPYEILAPIGAGGMGEVYRARDTRLDRTVAIKVIAEELAAHEDRLKRFEQEARATASLNHPNILALFDVGVEGEVHYIVEELLEGETLRERLRRERLPVREAVDAAVQIARGLAAAHEKGIVHRDLKPENVFLTRDGHVKVLDFGLAKLVVAPEEVGSQSPTERKPTASGIVLGTVGYMSPEQVRNQEADARSDIFSLGVMLYEMLAGRRAFSGASTVETLNAILSHDPPELSGVGTTIPVALDRVMRRCLEKRPEARFQSAHDLALALEAAAAPSSGLVVLPSKRRRPWQQWALRAGLAAAIIGMVAAAFVAGRRVERKPVPSFHQLTFRRGIVNRARFAPDGETVAYTAQWDGKPSEVFTTRLDLAEAQALSLAQGRWLAGLHGGEALVSTEDGRLAQMPLLGGTPRDVAENVVDADWGPTGEIAVVRHVFLPRNVFRLEYPVGRTLLESQQERDPREPRVSPRGDRVALVVRNPGGMGGDVVVLDRSGHATVLSSGWMEIRGLAWSPDGQEVWFTAGGPARGGASSFGTLKELHAVSLAGQERLLLRMAGDLTLQDVFGDGRVLVSHGRTRGEARGKLAGDEQERDLTYLDGTVTVGISADGRAVLFQESAQAGGPRNTVYLRRVGDSSPIRLGEGIAVALSPDGKRAIAFGGDPTSSGSRLMLLSAGAEPARELRKGTLDTLDGAWWTPDGDRVLFRGWEKGRPVRSYILQAPDGQPRPIAPEGTFCWVPSEAWAPCFHLQDKERRNPVWELRSLDGGETRPAPWLGQRDIPYAWSSDGRHAFVAEFVGPGVRVFRVEVATGRREPWLDPSPPDPTGVEGFTDGALTPDGRYYAYSYARTLSDLFLVEGLR